MKDRRGVERGRCTICQNCAEYSTDEEGTLKCTNCGCPPGAHKSASSDQGEQTASWLTRLVWTPVMRALTSGAPQVEPTLAEAPQSTSFLSASTSYCGKPCPIAGCNNLVDFDPNTGREADTCASHSYAAVPLDCAALPYSSADDLEVEDLESAPECIPVAATQQIQGSQPSPSQQNGFSYFHPKAVATLPVSPLHPQQAVLPGGGQKCALQECFNPCHVDDRGHVHECCGYTHAMEHQRRLAIQKQANQQVIKGVTHCLLPGCSNPVWPFENYCGKTHSKLGKKQGLKPPTAQQSQATVKDSSLCIIPECGQPKYVEGTVVHSYCGKRHAELGKKKGILPTAQTPSTQPPSAVVSTAIKDQSLCIIPECMQPKYVEGSIVHPYCSQSHAALGQQREILPTTDNEQDQCDGPGCTRPKLQDGTRVYDYCCNSHAVQDAPNRDARLLMCMTEVQKFLGKFSSSLKVVKMDENDNSKPGGVLFKKFKTAMLALPRGERQTCLAFHGTAEGNIQSIFANGYDPKKRSGQAYGSGEYFALSPGTPMGYCKGGRKLILNELLLGKSGVHHTKATSDIVVMQNPEHDLPRFVITFQ